MQKKNSEYTRRDERFNFCIFAKKCNMIDTSIVLKQIGHAIVKRRKEISMTQEDLAYIADIDRTYIGYIENGKQNITISILCKIANALDVDLIYLLK